MALKGIVLILLTLLLVSKTSANTDLNTSTVVWHTELQSALVLAKKEHKNVIVMVGEDNCRWCVKMKKQTLSKSCVQKKLQNYVLVSVKRSDKYAIKNLQDFDGIIPSFFFMQANEEPLDSIVGYFTADDFLRYIEEVEEE
ncbi:MAG: DUF255 domain-containing protein [Sulfurovum sp.]|nr:DUF255 domain-containing protein [Sulfurovum sp.]